MSDRDPETGQFLKGKKGGPGRPKGSRSKLGEAFIADMLADWEEHGADVIKKVRDEKPADYLKVVASILPKDLNVNINPVEELTDEQLIERIRQLDAAIRPVIELAGTGDVEGGASAPTTH